MEMPVLSLWQNDWQHAIGEWSNASHFVHTNTQDRVWHSTSNRDHRSVSAAGVCGNHDCGAQRRIGSQ